MTDKVIGIYSFPRSGNTWMRHILAGALRQDDIHTSIPDIYRRNIWNYPIQRNNGALTIYKSHSKGEITSAHGRDFVNDHVIYLIRHPLDVFLSQLNYISDNVAGEKRTVLPCKSVEDIIRRGDIDFYFGAYCTFGTLQPFFDDPGNWFENAKNWTDRCRAEPDRVSIVRYEDLLDRGEDALSEVATVFGLSNRDTARGLRVANKRTRRNGRFFWQKKDRNYRVMLPPELVNRFRQLFDKQLNDLGYTED